MNNKCSICYFYRPENDTCQSKKCCGYGPKVTLFDKLFCNPYLPENVRHGSWVAETDRHGNYAHCSLCGCRCKGYIPNYKFCPECGAKMDRPK